MAKRLSRPIVWHLAVLAVAAAMPFAALTAYLAITLIGHETADARRLVERQVQATAADAEQRLVRIRAILVELARRPAVVALDPGRCDPLLPELLKLRADFANVITLDEAGRRICSARPPMADASELGDPRYLLDAVRARKTFTLGRPAKGAGAGRWMISAVQPILAGSGDVAGIVGISLDLDILSEFIHTRAVPPETVVAILSPEGYVLTRRPDPLDWVGQDITASPIGRIALERRSGTARGAGLQGIERLWAFTPVPSVDWTVLAGIPVETALGPAYRTTAWIAALAALGIAFAALLSIVIARPIARPIGAIAASVRRLGSGDDLEPLVPQGPAEIASLAEEFNNAVERRRIAERDLGDSEARLKETQRSAHVGTWRFLADGSVAISDQMAELFQLAPGVPPTYAALIAAIHPEDRDVSNQAFQRALASDARFFDAEYRVVWPDGQVRSLQSIGRIHRDAGGRLIEASGTAHDITERKRAADQLQEGRQRLQGIVTSAMDAIITIDSDQRITLFNPAAERMFQVGAAQMIGRPLDSIIPPGSRANHSAHVTRFGETGGTSRTMGSLGTVHGLRASGETFPLEAAISQVTVGGRRFYTAILRDVSERMRAEREVQELNADLERRVRARTAELEAANRELHAFDYSISHDLRAPVNRIRGFSEALAESYGDRLGPEGLELLARVRASGESMEQLITDMLALSTISRGDVHRSDVDMSALALNILTSFQRADASRVVELVVPPGIRVQADPGLMRIALENLLGNAWKFTSKKESARIELGRLVEAGEELLFVRDNGAGFDPAKAGQLFEPFRRLHTQAEFRGTGIGLATVQRIFRRHGGRIWAESTPGSGATFWFTLSPAAETGSP